jgi:hypothetical protein
MHAKARRREGKPQLSAHGCIALELLLWGFMRANLLYFMGSNICGLVE